MLVHKDIRKRESKKNFHLTPLRCLLKQLLTLKLEIKKQRPQHLICLSNRIVFQSKKWSQLMKTLLNQMPANEERMTELEK